MTERQAAHYHQLEQIILKHLPAAISLEKIFVHLNPSSAIKLGYVRGLVYLLAGLNSIPLFEYAAKEVKAGTTGYGGADKSQVLQMICREFPTIKIRYDDESDALALALYHARSQNLAAAIAQAENRSR
jgi:crossover junction endodeoxyribonuclease RuvC